MITKLISGACLWAVAVVLSGFAYASATWSSSLDARLQSPLIVCGIPFVIGCIAAGILTTKGRGRMGATRYGLCVVVLAVCVLGSTHVGPHMSTRILVEEIPPLFGFLFPLISIIAPPLLAITGRRVHVADQILAWALIVSSMQGALFILEPPAALAIALCALLAQLGRESLGIARPWLLVLPTLLLLQLSLATAHGRNLIEAMPSLQWFATMLFIALALALPRRDSGAWRALIGIVVFVATLFALLGGLLVAWLALEIALGPALDTRLVLFRQHPNFLAPYFAFHALLALGLVLSPGRGRIPAALSALLLAGATIATSSRAGILALAFGGVMLVIISILGLAGGSIRKRLLTAVLIIVPLVAAAFWFLDDQARTGFGMGKERQLELVKRSLDFRLDAWSNSVEVIKQEPWLGIGPNTFITALAFSPESRFFHQETSPHPHNVFLYVAQSGGIPALILFVAWTAALFTALWRLAMARGRGALFVALLSAFLAMIASNLLDLGVSLMTVAPGPFFLLTGLLAARRKDEVPALSLQPGHVLILSLVVLMALWKGAIQPIRARTCFHLAHIHALDGRTERQDVSRARAISAMRSAIELDPTTPRAHERLARWLENQHEDVAGAIGVLLELLSQSPDNADTRSLLGDLHKRTHSFSKAASEYSAAISINQFSAHRIRDRANLIFCLARLGNAEEASNQLVAALEVSPAVIDLLRWNNRATAPELPVKGSESQSSVFLIDAVERLCRSRMNTVANGDAVGRRYWMDTVSMFRSARRDDRAMELLEFLERNIPSVEKFSIMQMRAMIAADAGDIEGARKLLLQAHDLTGIDYYKRQAESLLLTEERADDTVDLPDVSPSIGDRHDLTGDIVTFGPSHEPMLVGYSRQHALAGNHAEAADLLRRTLIYHDDPLDRARLHLRVATLLHQAGAYQQEISALRQAFLEVSSKPFPRSSLSEGLTDSLPARIARAMDDAWVAMGRDLGGRQESAWKLPGYHRWLNGPSLFRLAFYESTGQVDRLLREADLQLLDDPGNIEAMWFRVFALEGYGRKQDTSMAMRNLIEHAAKSWDIERVWENFVADNVTRQDDPEAWANGAILQMLRGYYRESAGMFGKAIDLYDTTDVHSRADALSWQARAYRLCGDTQLAREALDRALQLRPDDSLLRLRRSVSQ